jgi:hypothetical protein
VIVEVAVQLLWRSSVGLQWSSGEVEVVVCVGVVCVVGDVGCVVVWVCSVECVDGFGVGGRWGVVSIVVGVGFSGVVFSVVAIVVIVGMVVSCIVVVVDVFAISVCYFLQPLKFLTLLKLVICPAKFCSHLSTLGSVGLIISSYRRGL